MTGAMEPVDAELSSLATTLDDLSARVGHLAEDCQNGGDDTGAAELFEVERALKMAQRRLAQLVRRKP